MLVLTHVYIVAYSLKARILESQQPAVARQWPINRGMAFSVQSMLMAGHATVEYIMPSLSQNCTATEEAFSAQSVPGYIMN
jgi:hypothetical protein